MNWTDRMKKLFGMTITSITGNDVPPPVDTSRYSHVSVRLHPIDNKQLREMTGQRYLADQKGTTYKAGRNFMKRIADGIAVNNKDKRRLRMKARLAWEVAQA